MGGREYNIYYKDRVMAIFVLFDLSSKKCIPMNAFLLFLSHLSVSKSDEQRLEAEGCQVQFLKIMVLSVTAT